MAKQSISIVIPVHNEEKVLTELTDTVVRLLAPLDISYEIIIVDDGSGDGSWEKIIFLQKKFHGVISALRFTRNFGKEAAICAGMEAAAGDAVILMDADLQHPPELLPEMILMWRDKAIPIVEAVKERRQKEDFKRRIGAGIFYYLFTRFSGLDIHRATDFKLLDRKIVDLYLSLPERNRFFRGLTAWICYPSLQIPFVPPERHGGSLDTRWSLTRLISFALSSLISFSSAPLRIVTYLGILTFTGSFILGIQTLMIKFRGEAVPGFATVILIELILGSILMVALGLMGEYLARIYDEIKQRPLYVIMERLAVSRSTLLENRDMEEDVQGKLQGG